MPTKTGDMTDKERAVKNANELCKLANQRFMLQQENKLLRDALTMIVCESINAEYIAQNALDRLAALQGAEGLETGGTNA